MPILRPPRAVLGKNFSEGARQLWLKMIRGKLSQADAARLLELRHPAMLSRWLYGDRRPSVKWAFAIESKLKIRAGLWGVKPVEEFVPPAVEEFERAGYAA